MRHVRLYTSLTCAYCDAAKQLLARKGVAYEEIDVSHDEAARDEAARETLTRVTGMRTVPQIFIGEAHVGGFEDLQALDRTGKLDEMLTSS